MPSRLFLGRDNEEKKKSSDSEEDELINNIVEELLVNDIQKKFQERIINYDTIVERINSTINREILALERNIEYTKIL